MGMSRTRTLGIALALTMLAASCATVPPPGGPAPGPGGPPGPAPPVPPAAGGTAPPTGPPVPAEFELSSEPEIDVGLAWDLDTLRIEPLQVSGVSLQLPDAEPKPLASANPGSVTVRRSGGKAWIQFPGKEARWPLERGDTLWLAAKLSDHAARDRARWNNKTWRGTLKVFLNHRGQLTLA